MNLREEVVMGLIRFFSSDRYPDKPIAQPRPAGYIPDQPLPNPDPSRYKIGSYVHMGRFLIVKIHYLDCTKYEGNKLLMYENVTIDELKKQKLIDPHFSDNKRYISPIARFLPNDYGWEMAIRLAKALQ